MKSVFQGTLLKLCDWLKNDPKAGFFMFIAKMVVPSNNSIGTIVIVDSYRHTLIEGYRHYSNLAAETIAIGIVKIRPSVLLYEQIACLGLTSWLI